MFTLNHPMKSNCIWWTFSLHEFFQIIKFLIVAISNLNKKSISSLRYNPVYSHIQYNFYVFTNDDQFMKNSNKISIYTFP